jgi:hypothetical protein
LLSTRDLAWEFVGGKLEACLAPPRRDDVSSSPAPSAKLELQKTAKLELQKTAKLELQKTL